jgi:hypothetical protein
VSLRIRRSRRVEPLREWRSADGEDVVALHPLYVALAEFYAYGQPLEPAVRIAKRRLREVVRGERQLPELVAERIVELDRSQQARGCPDENVAGLVAVLQEGTTR